MRPDGNEPLAAFLGGFVAAEGSFNRTGRRFRFALSLAATETPLCETAAEVLGAGRVSHHDRRKPHYHDEAVFVVQSIPELVHHVVPFMDSYLPASKKRSQYLAWRTQLLDYWDTGMRRRRPCRVDRCAAPSRAKGLCRKHYYRTYRR